MIRIVALLPERQEIKYFDTLVEFMQFVHADLRANEPIAFRKEVIDIDSPIPYSVKGEDAE